MTKKCVPEELCLWFVDLHHLEYTWAGCAAFQLLGEEGESGHQQDEGACSGNDMQGEDALDGT